MFYSIIRFFAKIFLKIIDVEIKIKGKNNLPKNGNYILIAPHKSWLDPVFIALASSPKQFFFMAKKELFSYKFFGWFIKKLHAFPVDRKSPGPSAIKKPVRTLRKSNLSFIFFPSGGFNSSRIKPGIIVIAGISKKPIIPVIYKGPNLLRNVFKCREIIVKFGTPIYIKHFLVHKSKSEKCYIHKIQNSLDKLEKEV